MRITSPFILISIFLLLTSLSTLANNQALPLKTIAESAEQVRPLLNGQYIPSNITVTTSTGKKLALTKVINNQKTILFFYRGGWCPFCNTQMGQLKQIESQLSSLGFQLIGISTDNAQDLQKSIGKNHPLRRRMLNTWLK